MKWGWQCQHEGYTVYWAIFWWPVIKYNFLQLWNIYYLTSSILWVIQEFGLSLLISHPMRPFELDIRIGNHLNFNLVSTHMIERNNKGSNETLKISGKYRIVSVTCNQRVWNTLWCNVTVRILTGWLLSPFFPFYETACVFSCTKLANHYAYPQQKRRPIVREIMQYSLVVFWCAQGTSIGNKTNPSWVRQMLSHLRHRSKAPRFISLLLFRCNFVSPGIQWFNSICGLSLSNFDVSQCFLTAAPLYGITQATF